VVQGFNILPKGPLLLSPDKLFNALTREVVMKRPDVNSPFSQNNFSLDLQNPMPS